VLTARTLDGVGAAYQPSIIMGKQSSLLTHIATTESGLSFVAMKS
jgi:hypothetical protein